MDTDQHWLHVGGVTRGGEGTQFPGRRIAAGGWRKVPTMSQVVSSIKYILLLPKDLRFEHGGTKLASCPGRHLASLRPCVQSPMEQEMQLVQFHFMTLAFIF